MATKEKKATASKGFIAICDGTSDPIFGYGKTKKEAETNMWAFVHKYLVERDAPDTQDYTHEELDDYFGHNILELGSPAGYLHG